MVKWTRDRAQIQLYWAGWWVDSRGDRFDLNDREHCSSCSWSELLEYARSEYRDDRLNTTPECGCGAPAVVGSVIGDTWRGYSTVLLCDECANEWAEALTRKKVTS